MPPARASRTGESAAVLAVVRAGAAGKPGLAPVMGDAGIGKTRLVDALVAELGEQGPLVLSGHCSMGWPAQEVPLAPVVDALRQLRSGIGPDAFRRLVDPWTTAMTALLPSWCAGRSSRRIPSAPSRPEASKYAAVVDVRRGAGRCSSSSRTRTGRTSRAVTWWTPCCGPFAMSGSQSSSPSAPTTRPSWTWPGSSRT
jgi:hypothetical protein